MPGANCWLAGTPLFTSDPPGKTGFDSARERAPLSPRGDHGRRGVPRGTVALKVIKIGKDFGTNVEVIDGLAVDDQVNR